jgi:PAS domain S-box-containing protein
MYANAILDWRCDMEYGLTLEHLIDGISEGIFVCSLDEDHCFQKCIIWNQKMADITGYDLKQINDKVLQLLTASGTSLEAKISSWGHRFSCGETDIKEEVNIIHASGVEKIVAISAALQYGDDGLKHIITIVRDITEDKKKERELQKRNDSFKRLLELSNEAVFMHDGEKITWINKAAADLVGVEKPEDLIGQKFMRFLAEEYHSVVRDRIQQLRRGVDTIPFLKMKIIKADGTVLDVEAAAASFPSKDSYENLAVIRDLGPKIKMEEALRKSELKFREVFNHTSDALLINKIEDNGLLGPFLEVNDTACELMQYTREEFCSLHPIAMNPYAPKEIGYKIVEELKDKGFTSFQTEFYSKNASVIPVEASCTLIKLEDEEIVLSVLHDISERIQIENRLRADKERYRWLLDKLPYAIYVENNDIMVFLNKTGLEFAGFESYESVIGKKVSEIIKPHPDFVEEFNRQTELSLRGVDLPSHEVKFIRLSDNKVLEFETTMIKFPFYQEGDKLIVTKDISERKRIEKLQKAMYERNKQLNQAVEYEKLRTEFFANISHELRTPINVIFSSLQLLKLNLKKADNSKQELLKLDKYIGVMRQNCFRLIRLINNLIDVTKIDSGYFVVDLNNYNIVKIVEDITLSVAEYIENKGIRLIFDTDVEEKIIACDPDKIERIMLNLISNAVKFTEAGGRIDISITDKEDGIIIKVKDTGMGIPPEKKKIIFDRFIQVDKTLTRAKEGSGIGLSLVKSLVEIHNGSISVESEVGIGSEFTIELPVGNLIGSGEASSEDRQNMQENIDKINIEFSDIYF